MKVNLRNYSVKTKRHKVKEGKITNREISWLSFNRRVLHCANDKKYPLNERLRFLSISCSNLDEFIGVRYGEALKKPKSQPIKRILKGIRDCMNEQFKTYNTLKEELKKENVIISKVKGASKKERTKLEKIFDKTIFPMLTPISVGSVDKIPNFYNGQNSICCTAKQGKKENLIIIPIVESLDKMYVIDNKVFMIEDIIEEFAGKLFVNKEITSYGYFRIIKDASIILEHDKSRLLLERMEDTIEKREQSNPIFLQVSKDTPERLKDILSKVFYISEENIFSESSMLDYTRFNQKLLSEKYSFESFEPREYDISEETKDIFSVIKKRDILLQHPYDSYDTIVKFIQQASEDPDVVAIKQTLYRVSSIDSPIVEALCNAARNGKFVTVLIEIKARFDESKNISLINKLEGNGVNVLLGLEHLKTHCKLCMVVRKEKSHTVIYSHIATGNYNEKTATQYTDLSYLTAKQKVGYDLLQIFNILTGISTPDDNLQRIFYAPINLRGKLMINIEREIEHAKKGKESEIFLKLNSINDPLIIDKLYEATKAGVKVYVLSRGITSIMPMGNLYVKSIVGRFLEHSRIYYFKNDEKPEYYISSSDLLTRNLDRRVELMLLITDKVCVRKLKDIIKAFKEDRRNSFEMKEDGEYKHLDGDFDCHKFFIEKATKKP